MGPLLQKENARRVSAGKTSLLWNAGTSIGDERTFRKNMASLVSFLLLSRGLDVDCSSFHLYPRIEGRYRRQLSVKGPGANVLAKMTV